MHDLPRRGRRRTPFARVRFRVLARIGLGFLAVSTLLCGLDSAGAPRQEAASDKKGKPPAVSGAKPGSRPQGSSVPAASGEESEIKILSRTRDWQKERIFASGDVEIHYRQVKIFADRVELNTETKDVLAEGNVVIQVPSEVTRGERVLFNLETGKARIDKASGMIQPSVLFSADSIERQTPDRYSLRRATVTTCVQPVPRWDFSFSRANLIAGDYVEMWNAVLRVKKIPIFYLPYLRYPLGKSRATGFLMPKVGLSGAKGLSYAQNFYWALARNMDATVGFEYYLKRGLGLGLEYRYLLPGRTGGELNIYRFTFKKDAPGAQGGPASSIRLKHTQSLPFGFTLTADVDYQTSFDFLREFDNSFRSASVSNRSSQVYLTKSWGKVNLNARASLFETYFSELNDAVRNVMLPQVTLNVFKVRLFAPVFFSLNSSFNSWQYGWRSEYDAGTQKKSTSLSMSPALTVPFASIPWLTANTTVRANLVYYGQSYDAQAGRIVDTPLFTRNVAVNLDLTGPVFYRIFYNRRGEPSLKNVIEPFANYTYESPVSQSGRIVTTYGYFRYHQMSFGINNRFMFKQGNRSVEVFSLALAQTYYFSPQDGPLSRYPVHGKPPRFSELTGSVRFYPQARFSFDASLGYNPYYHNLSSLRVTTTAGSKAEGEFVSLSWFKTANSWMTGVDPTLAPLYNRDQVNVFTGTRLRGIGLDVQGEVDYNIRDRKLLYLAGQAIYHYQCLEFLLEVRAFYFRTTPDTQVRFSLGLGNIGRTVDFLGGMGF